MEQVLVVVERQRPEAVDGRFLSRSKQDFVAGAALELAAGAVEISVEVLRLHRPVVKHVGLGGARAVKVVDAKLRVVGRAIPAVASRTPVVLPLEERVDDGVLGLDRGRNHDLFQLGILGRRIKQQTELSVQRLFTWQRLDGVEHVGELIKEFLRHHPLGLAAGVACRAGNVLDVGPVDRLHLAGKVLERIKDDAVDYRLDRGLVLGRVILKDARDGVGERRRAPNHLADAVRLQAAPSRPHQQVEAGLGVVGLAEPAELVGACVVEGVDPEAVAKVGHLRDDGLLVEREVAEPVDDVLVGTGDKRLGRLDVVVQHADLAVRRDGQDAVDQGRLRRLRDAGRTIEHVHHRPAPDVGHLRNRSGIAGRHDDARSRRCHTYGTLGTGISSDCDEKGRLQ